MTVATATVGDIDVRYTERGDGPPVVFVHGLAEDSRAWSAQQDAIRDVRSVCYDLRGHGGSSTGRADGTLAQLGGDLVGLLVSVVGPATCTGFSLGGTVVLRAAADRPDLVRHAIVLGTSSVVGCAAVDFYERRIATVESGDQPAIRRAVHEDTVAALAHRHPDLGAVVDARVHAIGDGSGYVNAARAMARLRDEPLTPELSRVRSHVDVVGAEHDTFCPRKAAEILLAGLPSGTYHEIPDAGHLMNVDRPDLVTALLYRLLERSRP